MKLKTWVVSLFDGESTTETEVTACWMNVADNILIFLDVESCVHAAFNRNEWTRVARKQDANR